VSVRGFYTVSFSNDAESIVGVSEISWCVTVAAESEDNALELGLEEARVLNREFGLPPHRLKVGEAELRSPARVRPLKYA